MPKPVKRKPDQTTLFSWILPTRVRDNEIVGIPEDVEPATPPNSETEETPDVRLPKTSEESVLEAEVWDYSEDDGAGSFVDLDQQEADLKRQLKKRRPIV